MGWKRKTLHLTFPDQPGLEVYARSLSVGKAIGLMRNFGELDVSNLASWTEEQAAEMFGPFVKRVVSWTLEEDDGTPLPVTVEAFVDWDVDDAFLIFLAWIQKATSVMVPTVTSGKTATRNPLESTIPMDSASGM